MSSRAVKLSDVKVSDLMREVEKRDLQTNRTKAELQEQHHTALQAERVVPNDCIFEVQRNTQDLAQFLKTFKDRKKMTEKFAEISITFTEKLAETSSTFTKKLAENSRYFKE